MAINPYDPSNPARKKTGSGFTNLNRIMTANQGNRLGQAVGGGVAQQAGQAKEALGQAKTGFEQQSQAGRLDTDANKQRVQQGLQAADTGNVDQGLTADFAKFREGRYGGPQQLQNENQVINRAQQAQNLGGLASSSGGRQALLQRFVGGNSGGYSQGKQRLDSLLLGQGGQQDLRNARRSTQNLNQEALRAADAARQQSQYLTGQAQAFGQDVNTQLGGKETGYNKEVEDSLTAAQTEEAARQGDYEKIQKLLAAGGQRVGAENLRYAKDDYLKNVNEALGLASTRGVLGGEDQTRIEQLNDLLLTPEQQIVRQQHIPGKTAYLGYGTGGPDYTTSNPSGANLYSNLGLDEVLSGAFKAKQAENLTKTGIASDAQRAKEAALSKLMGKTSQYSENDPRFKTGSASFDLNKAGSDVENEIRRLKGESTITAPTEFQEPNFQTKVRNTLAPDSTQFGEQVKGDVNDVFGGDSSLLDRAGGLVKLQLDPVRGMVGSAVEQGGQLASETEAGLKDALGKNNSLETRAGGVAQIGNAGNMLPKIVDQVGNYTNSIPVVGGLASAPLKEASKVLNDFSAPTSLSDAKNKAGNIAKDLYNPGNIAGQAAKGFKDLSNKSEEARTKLMAPAQKATYEATKGLRKLGIPEDKINQINSDLSTFNKVPSGDPRSVLRQLGEKNQAAQRLAASGLQSIPGIGKLIPPGVMNAINGAVDAAKNIASKLFNPFGWCYGAGTPIKMKNGSYKAVEKLKVDDELYYGGKVLFSGQAVGKNMYEYKGTKLTGEHAVFENGKFVRVSDSIHGKSISGEQKVYPIECENHILVTKTHLSADFSAERSPEGSTPEQLIEKLNSDKARLKKLDTASALIFRKREE